MCHLFTLSATIRRTNIHAMRSKDILENEDVKLDNMFIASMVADIIRVSSIPQ